ncbi:type I-E CRISPR-associated protein Cas7/Cse4/CasC [Streptomyces uncialis]|uniref:type I-E CRISPR-associated protein Cas7/Cse4/CasC n=1 Tax=Streptomyces uncialis TaxID=1048205 RepID=UPI00382B0006
MCGGRDISRGVIYRYATLDLNPLSGAITDTDTARTLAQTFVSVFVRSLPSAKTTSTAPHTVPDLVHLTVRSVRPLPLAAAFEKRVRAREASWGTVSRMAPADYTERVGKLLATTSLLYGGHAAVDDVARNGAGRRVASSSPLRKVDSCTRCSSSPFTAGSARANSSDCVGKTLTATRAPLRFTAVPRSAALR